MEKEEINELLYGMFVHYGLYSLSERGEWGMNRERLSRDKIRSLSGRFTGSSAARVYHMKIMRQIMIG